MTAEVGCDDHDWLRGGWPRILTAAPPGIPNWVLVLFTFVQAPVGVPPRPVPKYAIRVDSSVMVPMRDGVKLATDIYFAQGAGERLPVILMRTPYDKRAAFTVTDARMFAGQGYHVLAQDVRGKFGSEGMYTVS